MFEATDFPHPGTFTWVTVGAFRIAVRRQPDADSYRARIDELIVASDKSDIEWSPLYRQKKATTLPELNAWVAKHLAKACKDEAEFYQELAAQYAKEAAELRMGLK